MRTRVCICNMIISKTIADNDIRLYRIMPLERFLQMLTSRKNVLVRPSLWNDPYESLLQNSIIKGRDGREDPFDESCWFGQCWSESSESDALWQVFTKSTLARGVKITTRASLLRDSLAVEEQTEDKMFFLEKVKYVSQSDDENIIKALTRAYSYEWGYEEEYITLTSNSQFRNDFNVMAAPMLLTKRNAFEHEREIRLLCYCKERQSDDKVYEYEIANWCNFIEEIQLDPWTPKGVDEALSKILLQYDMHKSDGSPLRATISDLYQECEAHIVYKPDI